MLDINHLTKLNKCNLIKFNNHASLHLKYLNLLHIINTIVLINTLV